MGVGSADTFGWHLESTKKGVAYTYLVEITGCPWAADDGRGLWTGPHGQTVIPGALADTDWSLDLISDPMAPLDVGGGLTISLHDEPSGIFRKFFAPNYDGGFYTRIYETAAPSDTSIFLLDDQGFALNDYLYVGLETVIASSSAAAGEMNVGRAQFGSIATEHRIYENETATYGPRVAKSPRVHRGRYVSIWIAPLEDDGTVSTTTYKIWAGRLASVSFDNGKIRLSCDNLLGALTKDDWPPALPTGNLGSDTATFHLTNEDFVLKLLARAEDTAANEEYGIVRMGYYDASSTFTVIPEGTSGQFTLQQIARYLSDTVSFRIYNTLGGTTQDSDIFNDFAIGVAYRERRTIALTYKNDTRVKITLGGNVGIMKKLLDSVRISTSYSPTLDAREGDILVFPRAGLYLSAETNEIEYYPDNAYDPLFVAGCYNPFDAAYVGYARISMGDNIELVGFTGVGSGSDGRKKLTGVRRGLGGTTRRAWGADPSNVEDAAEPEKVKIEQVWMIDWGKTMSPESFILPGLLSTGAVGANSQWDILGARLGLAIPEEFVDIDGIVARVQGLGLPEPRSYWVSEPKKGKEDLASFMQANGIYFTTKRFVDFAGSQFFGIGIESVDQASRATYEMVLSDSDRLAGTTVDTDFNERLIVNTVRLAPYWAFHRPASEAGGFVYAYAEESRADYHASKTLEIRPTAIYSTLTAADMTYTNGQDIYTGLATKIGLRWFGAYANGRWLLTVEAPHTGWKYLPGQTIRVTLTGVVSPEGDSDLVVTGRIMEVKQRHGKRPGATVVISLSQYDMTELAPAMQVTAHSGGTSLTIKGSQFSSTSQPFPFHDLRSDASVSTNTMDAMWFDYDRHTADGSTLKVFCWEIGDYSNGQEKTVSSMTYGASTATLVISSALSAGLQTAANNDRLFITFANYANASALARLFAYIGAPVGAAGIPLLNGVDEAPNWA